MAGASHASDTDDQLERDFQKLEADFAHGDAPPIGSPLLGRYSFERYAAQNDHYLGHYQTWTRAILFLTGRQWLKWLDAKRRYVTDTDVPPWKQQPVTNVTFAVYRTLATKLAKQKPTLEVVPPSNDSDDRESAHLAEAVLGHLWRETKKPKKIRRGIGWFLATGQVYLRSWFNPEAGPMVPLTQLVEVPNPGGGEGDTQDVECPCDESGEPITNKETGEYDLDAQSAQLPEGEIAFDIVDPLSVRWNPDAEDPDDATECMIGRMWPTKEAAAHFKVKEEDLREGKDGDREMYEDLVAGGNTGAGWLGGDAVLSASLGPSQAEAIGDRTLVVEYYRRPCAAYPQGRHWISCGRRKVWPAHDDKRFPDGEAPLPNGFWPPVVPVQDTPVPGQPIALGVLPQIVPLNEALNTLDGKILENHVLQAMGGKWITHPTDSGLTINSDPGQNLSSQGYAMKCPPIQAKLVALPEAVYREREVLMQKIQLVAALSEVELGKKPEGVSAGRAFLVLQEVTDSVLGPALEAWEHALEEIGRREIVLAQRYYRDERTIQIRGEKGKWEIRSFKGADLTDGHDVRAQVGSSFPWSKAAQWDTKLSLLQAFPGLVMKPDGSVDQERFAQFVDTAGTGLQSFESDEDPDLVEVQREHAMFEAYNPQAGQNEIPQLGFWQSHPKHLDAHYRFLKRDRARFDRWAPEAQQAFLAHCQQTLAAVTEAANEVAAAAAGPMPAAQGEPGQTGPDGRPKLELMPPAAGAGAAPSRVQSPTALSHADLKSATQ